MTNRIADRVVLIVLDGLGCGELPDASFFGDLGSNTLAHVVEKAPQFNAPNLTRWGFGHLTDMARIPAQSLDSGITSIGKCAELSNGKDTTSGHWEMAGIVVEKPFMTYPNGFPSEIVQRWVKENNLSGYLGNTAASGTEIIQQLGEEHIRTGKPILYTSADSVWQIAAHEEAFGLDRLYAISKSARKICDELNVSRVIARPFVGNNAADFKRTYNRKDYSQHPPLKTLMDYIIDAGLPTLGIGKISNIFDGRGIQKNIDTKGNTDGLAKTLEALDAVKKGLIFVNLIDFDMNYGHRRDIPGFAKALEEFDAFLPSLEAKLTERDIVILTADHGNDPSYKGTDHTREYIPFIVYQKGARGRLLGNRSTFADIGQTVAHSLTGKPKCLSVGMSIFHE